MFGRFSSAVFLLWCLSGCAPKHVAVADYQLLPGNPQPMLAPPVASPVIRITLKPHHGPCLAATSPIGVRVRRNALDLKIDAPALGAEPAEWLAGWAADLESQNCLPPGEGLNTEHRIVQSVPLPLNSDFNLVHPDLRTSVIQLIESNMKIQVISPIQELRGVETAWYAVRPRGDGAGDSIVPLFADINVARKIERHPQPRADLLRFPSDAAFFRLVYKSGQTDYAALVVAGRTRAEAAANANAASAPAGCGGIDRAYCVAIPRGDGINGMVPVTLNGKETDLTLGSTVGDALRGSGVRFPESVMESLRILKPWRSRIVPVDFGRNPAILNLVLSGGESISWGPIRSARDSAPFPAAGTLVDVGGYRVHLYCTGSGTPTVMIAGNGFSFDWDAVQAAAGKFARVCTWDPSGTAWSDPGVSASCGDRTEELRRLFISARIETPAILVGLSTGALVVRLYAAKYPSQIAGLVLVDQAFQPAGAMGQIHFDPTANLDSQPLLISKTPITIPVENEPGFNRLPERIQRLHRWAESQSPVLPSPQIATECEREVQAAEKPLSRPVAVVSTNNATEGYAELQQKALSLSMQSKQFISENSFHSVEISDPDVIVKAIQWAAEGSQLKTEH